MAPRHARGSSSTTPASQVLALVLTECVRFPGHPEWSDDPQVAEFGAPEEAYWIQPDFHALNTSPSERTLQSATLHRMEDSIYGIGIETLAEFLEYWDSDAYYITELRQLCMAGARTVALIASGRQAKFFLWSCLASDFLCYPSYPRIPPISGRMFVLLCLGWSSPEVHPSG